MEKDKRKHGDPRPNIFLIILSFIRALISNIGKGIGWGISKIASGLWWTIQMLAQGAWWLVKQVGNPVGWILKQPFRFLRYIIVGRIPEFENARQEEIFWRIKRQYRRKRLFLLNSLAYGTSILFAITGIGISYFDYQRYLDGWYEYQFYNALTTAGVVIGIWTVVLIFHFIFNRMGDSEDIALGDALAPEYARSEARDRAYNKSTPDIARLVDIPQEEYYGDYDEEKPKRNGTKM